MPFTPQKKLSRISHLHFNGQHIQLQRVPHSHSLLSILTKVKMATNSIKLLTGNSHPQLAKLVADRLGIELAKTMSLNYSNQETSVTVGESVRDEDGIIF